VNPSTPQDGEQLQQKIASLIDHLENEISELKTAHTTEIETLTRKCRLDMQKVHMEFSNELDSIERKHAVHLIKLADEIEYLKEMSHSQRLMMETNLEYIKELEVRYLSLVKAEKP
jgi:hypothetical protein